jgi:pimeloyl-ACP methyl ester carboxylesterase
MPREAEEPWTLEDYADLVIRELDERNITKTHIIAHSFGARVAALLVNMQPERFGKIVLAGPAGIRQRFNLWRWVKVRLHKRGVIRSKGSADYRTLSLNGKITFQNIIRRDLVAEISGIAKSTLIIWGTKDKSIKKYMVKRWTKLNTYTTMKSYKNAGHFCFLDEPARFVVDVEEFIGV